MNNVDYDDKTMCACLTKQMYDRIENTVVKLYQELKITKMPIDPFSISDTLGYRLIPSSSQNELQHKFLHDGFSGMCCRDTKGIFRIAYDDKAIITRQRFTIMHEIGHILLEHKEESDLADKMANYFASYALAPSPLVGLYNCEDYIDVVNTFNVSKECADMVFRRFNRWQACSTRKTYENVLLRMFNN